MMAEQGAALDQLAAILRDAVLRTAPQKLTGKEWSDSGPL
jgi:hypothetical protein